MGVCTIGTLYGEEFCYIHIPMGCYSRCSVAVRTGECEAGQSWASNRYDAAAYEGLASF